MDHSQVRATLKSIFAQRFYNGERLFEDAKRSFLSSPQQWDIFGRDHSVSMLVQVIYSFTNEEILDEYLDHREQTR